MKKQKAVLILDGQKEIYFDETVSINDNSFMDNCDRNLLDFAYDEIFNNKPIITLNNLEGIYAFPANKVLCLKQYKDH